MVTTLERLHAVLTSLAYRMGYLSLDELLEALAQEDERQCRAAAQAAVDTGDLEAATGYLLSGLDKQANRTHE